MEAGKLDFVLQGERLHGQWSLVRLKDDSKGKQNWLLIKKRDAYAVAHANTPEITEVHTEPVGTTPHRAARAQRATGLSATAKKKVRSATKVRGATKVRSATRRALPLAPSPRRVRFIPPQLATPVDEFPSDDRQWATELKFDGYRIVAYVDGARVLCFSRSGLDWTHRMPAVAQALATLGLQDAWLDGELVAVDDRGVPQFQRLQQALDPANGEDPILMVFDVLQLMGADLRPKPLRERRRLLQQALASLPRDGAVRLVDLIDDASPALRDRACEAGFEGVILKDLESDYRSGRNRAWLKLKCRREQEFVIGGYTRTAAGRQTLTALLLGYYDDRGRLHFAGRAGTGFSEEQLAGLRKRFDSLAQQTSPFADPPKLRNSERPVWVRPELVAQVRFAEWTESGILRQPLFLGLREDKSARDVRRELDMGNTQSTSRKRGTPAKKRASPDTRSPTRAGARVAARSTAPAAVKSARQAWRPTWSQAAPDACSRGRQA